MRKLLAIILLAIVLSFSGCSDSKENNPPSYFLEPDGYIIAKITYGEKGILGYSKGYGYISDEDYQKFLKNELAGTINLLHPYEENKSVSIRVSEIVSMGIGEYADYR